MRANSNTSGSGNKPRLPSCLVGATPEINAAALRGGGAGGSRSGPLTVEADPHRLSQRQKQVDYGKNTLGYDRYIQLVPKCVFPCLTHAAARAVCLSLCMMYAGLR